ncbi:glucuronate isomerase [Bifidobacterium sp. ESL0769]|uniref:glucuronate isomerase n=1 Tax=Bifidobacterium sp. ESL0769 TaxID=2983229 RepID=UPI0023F86E03|nr:glucuronate isomerase [Bifidobacterium sp. ESL0769]WEV67227.1 glucuronate isomerase [Bifidobacterium sp. ESL0769]
MNLWFVAECEDGAMVGQTDISEPVLSPDRLLPAEGLPLRVARELYESVKDLPIVSPHGHIPVEWFARDKHFANPTDLFITPDHYVTRILHGQGVPLSALGVGQTDFTEAQARDAFLLFGKYWFAFAGTPMRYWFEDSLVRVFGINKKFGPDSASAIYDELNEMLKTPEFSTRALANRFNMEFVSTTDDPVSDLKLHDQVNADPDFKPFVAPAFRPDKYLEPSRADWPQLVRDLGASADIDASTYLGFTEAMRSRRRYFKDHGAVLSDHSHVDLNSERLSDGEVRMLFAEAYAGNIEAGDAARLRAHLFNDQARFAQEDGLVMTVHPAIARNYDAAAFAHYGADVGGDIPARAEFVEGLRPLLNEYGNNPDFHFVAFTDDETVFSRELAPLAGFYPAFYIGAPWWFIDAPDSISRYFHAVVPYAGFAKLSGFIDDTRAICSIPSRHDMNRRVTASFVSSLVCDRRISMDEGLAIMRAQVSTQPKRVFKIGGAEKAE